MKRSLVVVLIAVGIYGYIQKYPDILTIFTQNNQPGAQAIIDAYRDRKSGIQISGGGKVSRILSDDNTGRRHQRFILRLSSGHTILIAHNIDLAPRISNLQKDDEVHFFGEYEWNQNGGVIHWTHHDPGGHHVGGWLKHNGRKYE